MPAVATASATLPSFKLSKKPKQPKKEVEGLVVHDLTEMKVARGVRTLVATEGRDAAIRECRRKVEKISRECRMDNVKYRDPHFDLLTMAEFCLNGLRQEEGEGDEVAAPAGSRRVGDLFENPKFIVDGIDAGDIKQGGAGDCWFLAAVATIANMPTLLESVCVARDEQVGVYGFVFFRDGEWISEVIDDQLFVRHPSYLEAEEEVQRAFATESDYERALLRGSNALHFAKCADSNETWLPLLEKAFAKAHGDYAAIEGGFTGEAVEDLTGGVTSEIVTADILDKDRFWTEELTKVNQELLFAAGITGVAAADVQGIITGHAYSVLKAVEVNGKRLVQMRNPWGQSEWTGAWSDGSPEWTAEWMTLLEHKFGDDGAFWMAYEDFLRVFTDVDRTRVFSSAWTVAEAWTQCQAQWPAAFHDEQFAVTLSHRGSVVIVLQQADKRYFCGLEGEYDFELHFRVRREGDSEYLARSKHNIIMTRSVNKELELDAGTWVVSFRVTRTPSGRSARSKYVDKYTQEHSHKFLVVARNYDYAHAKGLAGEEDWEDIEEIQEVEEEPAEEDQEQGEAQEGEEAQAEEEGEEEEEDAEEEYKEDSRVVVGIRVYAKDPELQVKRIWGGENPEQELDPDDSSVAAFLHGAADKSRFLSSSFRM